jgi:hypothetical protein
MSIPENISLNHIQTSLFSFLDKIWPHLKQQQKNNLKNQQLHFIFVCEEES